MRIKNACLYLLLITINFYSFAADIKVVQPSLHISEYYKALFTAMYNEELTLEIEPLSRAVYSFKQLKFDCFMAASIKVMKSYYNIDVIQSEPFLTWGVGVYTLKSKPLINHIRELEKKSAVKLRGNDFIHNLKEKYKLHSLHNVTSDQQVIDMLKVKRVDVAFYWYPSFTLLDNLHRNNQFSVYESQDALVCHPNRKNELFIQDFNQRLKTLNKMGWFEKNNKNHIK
ncbi:MAG: hypothetical protein JKX75_09270 [Gammaproteobacteria bacterium]|nr:hypothetical protein [Gammaproteobacteria bacterium]